MRYLSGDQSNKYGSAELFLKKHGVTLDRKLYTYFLLYKGDKVTDFLPDGAIIYSDYTGHSITMDVYTPRCLIKGVIKSMFKYPFDEVGVHNLFGAIESDNINSVKTFTRLGCKPVACIYNYYGPENHRLIYWTNRENIARWIE